MKFPAMRRPALAVAIVSIGLPLAAVAQGTGKGATDGSPPARSTTGSAMPSADSQGTTLPAADRQFMEKAALSSLAEVEMGRLAQKNASNDRVKQFGQRMVEDHGKATADLAPIANKLGVKLPTSPDKEHQQAMEKLKGLSGAEFDREYMKLMVEEHRKDVAEFERQTTTAQNEQLRQFAQKSLPTLQEHLKMAQSISGEIQKGDAGGSGSMGSGSMHGGSMHGGSSAGGDMPKTEGSTSPSTTSPGMKGSGMHDGEKR